MEPPTEKLEYESDSEETEGAKKESRTTVLIKAVEEEGTDTAAVVQGMSRSLDDLVKARAKHRSVF